MSYKINPARLLRHLAVSYRKVNRKELHEEKKARESHNEKGKIISELRHNLIELEKKYATMLLDKGMDREKSVMLAEKIQALKEKLS